MRALVVAGARPNFMKVAPILRELGERGHEGVLVHTGQHYDARMSGTFFDDLRIPEPDRHLGLGPGSGSHAVQTARVMELFEPVLREISPDWVVVVGDVNSTLACALVAAKLREELGCGIAHVEAGLRSRDWRMPEEVNRVVTDQLSDLLLTPSDDALPNLLAEGIGAARVRMVGNVMIDTLRANLPRARERHLPRRLGLGGREYAVATLHRPSNVDDPDALHTLLKGLDRTARLLPVVLPLHPRTRARIEEQGLSGLTRALTVVDPLGYLDMLSLTAGARTVLTDSGGLQEETTALGVPCVTLREQTERPITILQGTNRLVEWPLSEEGIYRCACDALDSACDQDPPIPEGWDGHAARRIVDVLAAERVLDPGALGPHPAPSPAPTYETPAVAI